MARRQFNVIDVVEVLEHWHAGRPKSVVASSLGLDPKTVRKYIAPAEAAGLEPGGAPLGRGEWSMLVKQWFPELIDHRVRSRTFTTIDAHRARIATMLETNSVAVVHQRLRDEHELGVGITSFREYVAAEFAEEANRAKVTVLRPPVPPGEEAQIDYGLLGSWTDPFTNKVRRIWGFVMVLAFSRHMFVRPVIRLDELSWVSAHVAAFSFFGGVTSRLVPDNLATGVDRADLYDPKINRAYGELAAHYGCLVDPARARKPKDKPRVERPMRYVRDSFFRGCEFVNEAEMQAAAIIWCTEVAGRRQHRGIDGAQPIALFEAVERNALLALPRQGFELARWHRAKVGADCHVRVAGALYSVPWRNIGKSVDAREGERRVEIFLDGLLIKSWAKITKGRQTDFADYPPEKIAFFMRTPVWCRRHAADLGAGVAELVAELLSVNALHRLRSAQGVIGLAERYGAQRLDAACRRALLVGDPTYRTVKGILIAGNENDGVEQHPLLEVPAHLHGPQGLFEGDGAAS